MIYNFIPVDPYEDIKRLRTGIKAALEEYYAGYPPCVIYEENDKASIRFFAPGMSSMEITATPESLTVTLERKKDEVSQKLKEERVFGVFKRTVNFPFKVDTEKYDAVYGNGILTVTFERAEADKPKKIKIGGYDDNRR
ncbi:Hsp20/alpha crystallin family protein [candidate division WOR-3 bacterium]|nr:Hsp20/alpha crystallin family protein [candidate division WOR-3 bacterium]